MELAQIQQLLVESSKVIRALQQDREKTAGLLAEYRRRDLAEEIVALLDERGMSDTSVPHKQKLASVLASNKDLGMYKEALRLSTTDMSFAKVSDEPGSGSKRNALAEYLLS